MYRVELKNILNPEENINIMDCKYSSYEYPVHTHEFAELIFVVEGSCTHYIDGHEYTAAAGDLLFVNYRQTHSFKVEGQTNFFNILYAPEFFDSQLINSENIYDIFKIVLLDETNSEKDIAAQKVNFTGNENEEIKKIVFNMHKEFVEKKTGYKGMLNGYSRILFSKFLRKFILKNDGEHESVNRIVKDCMEYIDMHCFGKLTLDEIAKQTFYNPSYLSRVFKQYCGQNLWDYVKEKRVSEAARLLRETDMVVVDIMQHVGYTDKKIFYRHFKEIFDKTPAEYRRK